MRITPSVATLADWVLRYAECLQDVARAERRAAGDDYVAYYSADGSFREKHEYYALLINTLLLSIQRQPRGDAEGLVKFVAFEFERGGVSPGATSVLTSDSCATMTKFARLHKESRAFAHARSYLINWRWGLKNLVDFSHTAAFSDGMHLKCR